MTVRLLGYHTEI